MFDVFSKDVMDVLRSDEYRDLTIEYHDKFNKYFPGFNYIDFPDTDEKRGIDTYMDLLRAAVKADKPLEFTSHRYDFLKEEEFKDLLL